MHPTTSRYRSILASAMLILTLSACGPSGPGGKAPGEGAAAGFPVTVSNCGRTFTITKPPQRIVAISDDAVNNIAVAGGVNRNTAATDNTGKLSKEAIIAEKPDMVIGEDSHGVSVDDMKALGIPFLVTTATCTTTDDF